MYTLFCTTINDLSCFSFFFFFPLFVTRFLFDILPVTTEANPTDVSKATGVKLANTHFVISFFSWQALGLFVSSLQKCTMGKLFPPQVTMTMMGGKIKFWCYSEWFLVSAQPVRQKKKISNLRDLSEWQLMALRQPFKDLSCLHRISVSVCLSSHLQSPIFLTVINQHQCL